MTIVQSDVGAQAERNVEVQARPRYRWMILFISWFALLICFVDRLAWGNLSLDVGRVLDIPLAALGAFVTSFYVGYVVSCVIGGFIVDRIGARISLSAGLIALGVMTAAFGFTRSFVVGLAVQALMGLASGVDFSAGVKLNASWFDKLERGRAFGVYMTATSLAVVLTNSLVPLLASGFGWSGTYLCLGLATVVIGFLTFATLRDGKTASAEDRGQRPDFRLLLAKPDLVFIALSGFGAMWGTWGFAFWAYALMVKGHGLAPSVAAPIMVLFGVGAIVAKPIVGLASDWLGGLRKIPIIVCLAGFVLSLLAFGEAESPLQFQLLAPALGVFAFAYSPLMSAVIAETAGTQLAASATGLTNALWQLGSVIVPLVVGAVFSAYPSFPITFATLAAGPLFGALVIGFVRAR
jgi:sugar phosphate permease